jgi:pimeloyl-ACP methyl ester carboxylesterase
MKREKQLALVNGSQIYCEFINRHLIAGDMPLLVFLHEGLGSVGQWKDFPDQLSGKLKLPALLYDRYGYGQSDERKELFYPDFLHDEATDWLPKLFTELGFDTLPKILIGHSDGATIALLHAAFFSQNILGVVSEAAHVMVEETTRNGILRVKDELEKGKLAGLLHRYHGRKSEQLIKGWTDNWLSSQNCNWNIEDILPRIGCPVLIIQGDQDHFGTFAQVSAIRDKISGSATVLYIPGCGHIPHLQVSPQVIHAIEKFVQEITNH